MRGAFVASSIASLMVGTSSVLASTFAFQTVVSDAADLDSTNLRLTSIDQVVTQNGKQVGAIVTLEAPDDSDPDTLESFSAVTFTKPVGATPYGNGTTQIVGLGDGVQKIFEGNGDTTPPAFSVVGDSFKDLAVTGTSSTARLTFVATSNESTNDFAILQYEPDTNNTAANSTQIRTVFQGDTVPATPSNVNVANLNQSPNTLSQVTHQVNASGTVLFGTESSGKQLLVSRSGTNTAKVIVNDATGPTDFNDIGTNVTLKRVITASGDAVFLAPVNGVNTEVLSRGAVNASRVNSGNIESGYEPTLLLGATDRFTLSVASNGTSLGDFDKVYVHDTLGSPDLLGTFATGGGIRGQMSASGKAVMYLPPNLDTSVDASVAYYDAMIGLASFSYLEVGDEIEPGFFLDALSIFGGSSPLVNDDGTVVFDAMLNDGTTNTFGAFVAWKPGSAAQIIVYEGQTITVDGSPVLVTELVADSLAFRGDVLKDGLSEDNSFAFGVYYDDEDDNSHAAILLTSFTPVPEPTSAACILLVAGAGLLKRRSRRR